MQENEATAFEKRLVFHQTGDPAQVLRLQTECSVPQAPAAGHVRVRILAAPINPADLNTIEGTYGVKLNLPATPGIEGCGVVEASGCSDFAPGDKVIFLRRAATWASHATVLGSSLYRLPPLIDPLQAAMLKVNPATAWRLLHGFTPLAHGETIVQNVGNSGVGRCVIQIASGLGIRTISFVRRPQLIAELESLGADHVFLDDDSGHAAAKQVLGGAQAALAFNAVGGDSALRLMKLLREGACHITYGAMARQPVTVPNGMLIFRDIQVRGLWVSRWIENARSDEVAQTYLELATRVVTGNLVQPVDSTYSLEAFPEALTRNGATGRSGKVLFVPES